MKDNSDETVKVAEAFKQKHKPSNKVTVHALISEMETFVKSNFKSEQHVQWQKMHDRVNDSMAICHARVAPPTTVHQFIQDITSTKEIHPFQEPTDENFSHPQALKTIHMSIPKEYLLADQEMLAPRLSILESAVEQPAINKMICTSPTV